MFKIGIKTDAADFPLGVMVKLGKKLKKKIVLDDSVNYAMVKELDSSFDPCRNCVLLTVKHCNSLFSCHPKNRADGKDVILAIN